MNGEVVKVVTQSVRGQPTHGTAGLKTQLPGTATTVSAIAAATGNIEKGKLIETTTE